MAKSKIVGYIDEDGFTYCEKHGHAGMDSIFANTPEAKDQCKVCGMWLTYDDIE